MQRLSILFALCSFACGTRPNESVEAVVSRDAGGVPPPPVPLAPAPSCVDPFAAVEVRTRVAGEFYLGGPVLCGRGGTNGATCLDTKGGVIWCPITPTQACVVRSTNGSTTIAVTPLEKE